MEAQDTSSSRLTEATFLKPRPLDRYTLIFFTLWVLVSLAFAGGFELLSSRIMLSFFSFVPLASSPDAATPMQAAERRAEISRIAELPDWAADLFAARAGAEHETPRVRVQPSNGHFVDEHGRTRIFHGLNVVYKQPPFVPTTDGWDPFESFSERDAADLRRWGFNLIRLGVLWAGTYPADEKTADEAYLRAVQRVVQLCEAAGIYVVVDMHSDVLSRRFCGNGAPDWVVDDALRSCGQVAPTGDFPLPVRASATCRACGRAAAAHAAADSPPRDLHAATAGARARR